MKTTQFRNYFMVKDLSMRGQKLNERDNEMLFQMQLEYKLKRQQGIEEANRIKKNQQTRENLKKYILGGK